MAQRPRPKLTDLVKVRPAPQESPEQALVEQPAVRQKPGRRPSADPRVSYTVGLRQSEVEELAEIAQLHHLARNALGVFLLRYGLKQLRDGKLKLPVKERVVSEIEMP